MSRALAHVLRAVVIGLDYLAGGPTPTQAPVVSRAPACPLCTQPLTDTPHRHTDIIVWPTVTPGTVLLTDPQGADPCLIVRPSA